MKIIDSPLVVGDSVKRIESPVSYSSQGLLWYHVPAVSSLKSFVLETFPALPSWAYCHQDHLGLMLTTEVCSVPVWLEEGATTDVVDAKS